MFKIPVSETGPPYRALLSVFPKWELLYYNSKLFQVDIRKPRFCIDYIIEVAGYLLLP